MKSFVFKFISITFTLSLVFGATNSQISTYRDRGEIVKREYKYIGKFIVSRFGVFDHKTKKLKTKGYDISKLYQESELSCLAPIVNSSAMSEEQLGDLAKFVEYNDTFFKTKYGVLVEKACLNKAPKVFFEKNILASYNRAVSCLQNLNGPGAKDILVKINDLFINGDKHPKIFCSESNADLADKGISWDTAKAYASAGDEFNTEKMKHPFISLGQKWSWEKEPYHLQSTLFHELLHNAGCIHTKTVETSYTCQTCCFSEIDNPNAMMSPAMSAVEQKEIACRICESKYQGITDKRYIEDFARYAMLGPQAHFVFPILKNYMKERPGDNFALEIFLKADSHGLLKVALSNLLKGSKTKPNSKYDRMANVLYHYARGEYVEAADFLREIKNQYEKFSEESYASLYNEIERDLMFMSFSDSRINVQGRSIFDDVFNKSKSFLSSEITLKGSL